jgi:N-acetylornithine carbamoyltransferase
MKGIDELEKQLLAQNKEHIDWQCTEKLMNTTKNGKALYMHCLPADITDISCKSGEVAGSVFNRYRSPLYKQASYKPYIIASMILLSKIKDPAELFDKLSKNPTKRKWD